MRRPGATLIMAAFVLAGACRLSDAAAEWHAGAARAVARNVQAANSDHTVVVLGSVGGPRGEELPWAVVQSLTTGGVEVGDTTALRRPRTLLLIFEHTERADGEWIVDTRLERGAAAGDDEAPDDGLTRHARWRVQCNDDPCVVTDMLQRPDAQR
ncbi:hypothetical protein BH23GEM9_BH23GEM9_22000 [soil metagenome]